MTIDWTEKLVTNQGHNVYLLATDIGGNFNKVGIIKVGEESVVIRMNDYGEFAILDTAQEDIVSEELRIVNDAGSRKVWVNILRNTAYHRTKGEADQAAKDSFRGRIACVEIDYVPGQGLLSPEL
jgi:hypothetical protein